MQAIVRHELWLVTGVGIPTCVQGCYRAAIYQNVSALLETKYLCMIGSTTCDTCISHIVVSIGLQVNGEPSGWSDRHGCPNDRGVHSEEAPGIHILQ